MLRGKSDEPRKQCEIRHQYSVKKKLQDAVSKTNTWKYENVSDHFFVL